jgi:tungstate transport system substrate-binding protein
MAACRLLIAAALVLAVLHGAPARAGEAYLTIASTTSTEQSGLFRHLLPLFEKKTGAQVRVIAAGSGQALDMGRRGDADVVFVHDPAEEERFVAEGHASGRYDVMYNEYVLIGPQADPAGAAGSDIVAAFRKIVSAKAPFVSRGDRSGTHAAELRYWHLAGIDPGLGKGSWYRETGSGMGPTLNTAAAMNGYTLSDRGTWLSFRNRAGLAVLVRGDGRLYNQYGIMLVSPARHPHVKKDLGQAFIDWITSPEGQRAIADYRIGGEVLFIPNAQVVAR